MKTITIDVLNEKAIDLLRDLELLKLIRLRKDTLKQKGSPDWAKYKGAMTKQSLNEVNQQLIELRSEWE